MEKRVFLDGFSALVDQYVSSARSYTLAGAGLELVPDAGGLVFLHATLPDTFDGPWRAYIWVKQQPGSAVVGVRIRVHSGHWVQAALVWKTPGTHGNLFDFYNLLAPDLGEAVLAVRDEANWPDNRLMYHLPPAGDGPFALGLNQGTPLQWRMSDEGETDIRLDQLSLLPAAPVSPFWLQLRALNENTIAAEVWDQEPVGDDSASPTQSVTMTTQFPLAYVDEIAGDLSVMVEGDPQEFPASGEAVFGEWSFFTGVSPGTPTAAPGDIQAQKAHGGIVRDHSTVGGGKTPGAQIKEL